MIDRCFLGANTPEGFRSEYRSLQTDPAIHRLLILKGGPGCGKSTLMKTVAESAENLGLRTRRIFCSSDPESLDGLVVPELGFAMADGTAPHVMEPELCGCGENYINLGRFYRASPAAEAGIRAEKNNNRLCYGPVYAALAGCAAAQHGMQAIAGQTGEEICREALRQLAREKLPEGSGNGHMLRCYLSGITPAGMVSFEPSCRTVWVIRDSFRLAAPLLGRLCTAYRKAGHDVVLAMDPLDPDQPAGLLIPELETAYLRIDPLFPLGKKALKQLNLDAAAESVIPASHRERMSELLALRRRFAEEALFWLRRAKVHHDALESLCRPMVDYDAVTAETERIVQTLLNEA